MSHSWYCRKMLTENKCMDQLNGTITFELISTLSFLVLQSRTKFIFENTRKKTKRIPWILKKIFAFCMRWGNTHSHDWKNYKCHQRAFISFSFMFVFDFKIFIANYDFIKCAENFQWIPAFFSAQLLFSKNRVLGALAVNKSSNNEQRTFKGYF